MPLIKLLLNKNVTVTVAHSKSKNLKGKKGKSFGYYYVDGKLKHESTAWMNFKF